MSQHLTGHAGKIFISLSGIFPENMLSKIKKVGKRDLRTCIHWVGSESQVQA